MGVPEGGSNTYTVTLNNRPSGTVRVRLSAQTGGDSDITFSPSNLYFYNNNSWPQTRTVTVRARDDADGLAGNKTIDAHRQRRRIQRRQQYAGCHRIGKRPGDPTLHHVPGRNRRRLGNLLRQTQHTAHLRRHSHHNRRNRRAPQRHRHNRHVRQDAHLHRLKTGLHRADRHPGGRRGRRRHRSRNPGHLPLRERRRLQQHNRDPHRHRKRQRHRTDYAHPNHKA